jgi:hypothetical protein
MRSIWFPSVVSGMCGGACGAALMFAWLVQPSPNATAARPAGVIRPTALPANPPVDPHAENLSRRGRRMEINGLDYWIIPLANSR